VYDSAEIERLPVRTRVLLFVAVVVALYALVCVAVAIAQSRLVYYPGPAPTETPRDHGLAYDDLQLTTRDGETIHAWLVHANSPRGAILLCHGNAGNIAARIARASKFVELGFDVLLFDYRGYGGSSGKPTEEGTYVDAETAWEHLRSRGVPPERIVAFGESLGGAVAIELARRRALGAVIVEDTFTSLADMGAKFYPWLPVRWILRIRYDSLAKVGALNVPFLVIHSRDDELVPFEHGERLFQTARGPKKLLATSGSHNAGGFVGSPEWVRAVDAFLVESISAR
jgi:fermentation-respiration switch protein FrsA (DUF1100 family)